MAAPGPALEPETLTRKRRIDAALRESGWRIVPHLPGTPFTSYQHAAVTEFPTANGPADYALIANNRILAIVEAKRTGLAIQEVLTQAQRYARAIQQLDHRYGEYGAPFLFSANGQTIRFLDIRDPRNTARDLAKFPTPSTLEEQLSRDPAAALADGKRRMLVAMATGTGKTYTTVNQIYRLMKSGVARPLEQHQSPTPH